MPREFFLIFTFTILVGMSAIAHALGMSEAIGALMGGVILSETSVRAEIEERFLAFRDIFAALFFFVFGLSIDIDEVGRLGWLLALAVVVSVAGKLTSIYAAGRVGGFTQRQSVNAGAALVARGEFTIIIAQLAAANEALSASTRADLVAFAGLYVLATALIGVILMKESKRLGRRLFPPQPRLIPRE
jgi:CPA2 family monovalent cation:H+ antiporter-2